jgi:bifunctional NMN adenylyltransferase/nudix hydrolase
LHNAHVELLNRAAEIAERILVITGSANQPRTYKNPFTSGERGSMIYLAASRLNVPVAIESNPDTIYNDQAWVVRVQSIINKHASACTRIAVIGHKKDESSFYLDMFPQWSLETIEELEHLSAVNIRDLYFKPNANMNFIRGVVPDTTFNFLTKFKGTAAYEQIIRERQFVEDYKKQFAALPYAPVFVTTDAVVIQSGHVLMIKRRSEPGKGLWALPGGFLNAATDKSVQDAMIRELREETCIKVPAPVLKGSIVASKVFDAIDRSARGRTITHAFKIVLPDGELPKVKGADDAEKARWVPIAEVRSEDCFEDHYEIVQHFVGA